LFSERNSGRRGVPSRKLRNPAEVSSVGKSKGGKWTVKKLENSSGKGRNSKPTRRWWKCWLGIKKRRGREKAELKIAKTKRDPDKGLVQKKVTRGGNKHYKATQNPNVWRRGEGPD